MDEQIADHIWNLALFEYILGAKPEDYFAYNTGHILDALIAMIDEDYPKLL